MAPSPVSEVRSRFPALWKHGEMYLRTTRNAIVAQFSRDKDSACQQELVAAAVTLRGSNEQHLRRLGQRIPDSIGVPI